MSTINLVKGQKINLQKSDGSALTRFCAGANWGAHRNGRSIDLDLHAAIFDSNKNLVEHIYYGNRFSQFGRNDIWLTEDDLDGDEGGEDDGLDNETFYMDLNKLPATCEKVAVFLCSFSGDDFGDVPHASVRLYEGTHDRPTNVLAQYNLASDPSFSGSVVMVMGVFYRHNGAWKFNAVGTPIGDRDARQAIESIKRTIL